MRDAERQRIARELHDSTSQLLVALQLKLGELGRSRVPRPVLDVMAEVIRDIQNSIKQISSRRSNGDEDTDGAKAAVAKMFYSIGTLDRSA